MRTYTDKMAFSTFLYLHVVVNPLPLRLLILDMDSMFFTWDHTRGGYGTPVKLLHPVRRLALGSSSWFTRTSLLVVVSAEGCEVGQWSEWGACTRRNKTCGYKWGLETRTRHIVKKPPKDTIPCPTIAESRMCKMAMRHCRRGRI